MSAKSSSNKNVLKKWHKYGAWIPGWDEAEEILSAEHAWAAKIRVWEGSGQTAKPMAPVKYLTSSSSKTTTPMASSSGRMTSSTAKSVLGKKKWAGVVAKGAKRRKLRNTGMGKMKLTPSMYAGPMKSLRQPAGQWGMSHAGELKFLDTTVGGNLSSTGALLTTNGNDFIKIPQGQTVGQRIGNKAWISKLAYRGRLLFDPAAGPVANSIVTIYLILDTSANGTQADALDVFTSTAFIRAHHNLTNSSRFRVLKKIELPMNANGSDGASGTLSYPVEFYVDWPKGLEIYYDGTAGVIGERTKNNLFMMAYDSSNGLVNLNGNMRIRYRD